SSSFNTVGGPFFDEPLAEKVSLRIADHARANITTSCVGSIPITFDTASMISNPLQQDFAPLRKAWRRAGQLEYRCPLRGGTLNGPKLERAIHSPYRLRYVHRRLCCCSEQRCQPNAPDAFRSTANRRDFWRHRGPYTDHWLGAWFSRGTLC